MLYVQETYVNASEGYGFGESDVHETFTDDIGELYRSLRSEYGRCIGKVYMERDGRPPITIGWVFHSRQRYEDTGESYLREVWVTVHDSPPTKTIQYHYHESKNR